MVLAAPAFNVKLYVPFARAMIAVRQALTGVFTVNSYVKASFLSHDPERIHSYNSDPLITRPIASNVLLDLYSAAHRCVEDADAINIPTLMLVSGDDWVVEKTPQYAFVARLGSTIKSMCEFPGFYHDTLGELRREQALVEIRRFLKERFFEPFIRPDLNGQDRQDGSYHRFAALKAPEGRLERYYWSAMRYLIRIAASVSEGYRIGMDTGFDSGTTLDYVYGNQPSGRNWLGRQIDRIYLNSIGWRGIRQRKLNLHELITWAIEHLREADRPVRIVDIAAGHGRYLLDAIQPFHEHVEHLLLRDYSDLNVAAGQTALKQRKLEHIGQFVKGDAFDKTSLATLSPAPTLAVVSGLYELFPENDGVNESLAGLAEAVPTGGYLVYTNQPWHPQQTLIARALTSHRGNEPWVMRCRSQAEMDQLVENAGFQKCQQLVDQWGIFTVSVAQRL